MHWQLGFPGQRVEMLLAVGGGLQYVQQAELIGREIEWVEGFGGFRAAMQVQGQIPVEQLLDVAGLGVEGGLIALDELVATFGGGRAQRTRYGQYVPVVALG